LRLTVLAFSSVTLPTLFLSARGGAAQQFSQGLLRGKLAAQALAIQTTHQSALNNTFWPLVLRIAATHRITSRRNRKVDRLFACGVFRRGKRGLWIGS